MEAVISNIGQLVLDNGKHKLYKIKWNIIRPLVSKWSRNRDPDMGRVQEMTSYIQQGGYVPLILHIAELPEEGLVCYDGNHRRECFNNISETVEEIIVDVMFSATQKEVYHAFENINKSVQVPAIYIEEQSDKMNHVREDILSLVKQLENKYKAYVSTSTRCHAPHFNRDKLTDNIYSIWCHFNGTITIEQIKKAMTHLNQMYSQQQLCKPHKTYNPNVIKKCSDNNLWLFINKDIPVEHIEYVLEKQ